MKKVLVLTGSPRAGGNSDMLADAFVKGAVSAGHHVDRFDVGRMDLKGCNACNGCWNGKRSCVINDGMREIEPHLESADVLVMATPIYWSLFPAQLKALIDRFYSYDPINGFKKLEIKESVLLTCGETESGADFDTIKAAFRMISEFNGMSVRAMIAVPAVNFKGDIQGNAALSEAETLGKEI